MKRVYPLWIYFQHTLKVTNGTNYVSTCLDPNHCIALSCHDSSLGCECLTERTIPSLKFSFNSSFFQNRHKLSCQKPCLDQDRRSRLVKKKLLVQQDTRTKGPPRGQLKSAASPSWPWRGRSGTRSLPCRSWTWWGKHLSRFKSPYVRETVKINQSCHWNNHKGVMVKNINNIHHKEEYSKEHYLTPGISPTAWPLRPNPETRT